MKLSNVILLASTSLAAVAIESVGPSSTPLLSRQAHEDMDMPAMPAESGTDLAADGSSVEDASEDNNNNSGNHMEMPPSPMSMSHHHGRPILEDPDLEPQQRKYWEMYNTTTFFNSDQGNKFNLWMHTILLVLSVAFLAPLAIIMSEDNRTQWLYVPLQTLQSVTLIAAIVFLALYSHSAPDLYPGNAYSSYSIAMFVLVIVHWIAMVLRALTSYMHYDSKYSLAAESEPLTENAFAMEEFSDEQQESTTEFGSGSDMEGDFSHNAHAERKFTPNMPQQSSLVKRFANNRILVGLNNCLGRLSSFIFRILNLPLFLTELGYLLTGLATAFVMGKGRYVFALLAHFIKGFVFFMLGFIEMARYFGVCASRGWAWNEIYVPADLPRSNSLLSRFQFWPNFPTVEYWQCFAMFLYGSTNVFLEHLGNTDGIWSHKDLQHASIAFMLFGGGLCGMILESEVVKRNLESAFGVRCSTTEHLNDRRRGWSYNAMPAFIVFWTGALMSHHEQETELSTAIHIQWGTMFSMAAVCRLITLAILYTKTPTPRIEDAARPQRPFTELLVSFLLVCGGLIFMSSNRESVEALIYRGVDQMFTLNVSVGITVILMAIFIMMLCVKGWAARRYL
ncbi:Tvs1 protein [Starmerella bacillaris]|uniref:Tvs1 protein n=1 Tax=Starmerella bacillaris TaxID=1247836 RepID=A0AAV5RI60_STABA|nr:Tvs1 protein [Starmerella bacillaris]